ncbi:hypothetical protein LCGC14_1972260, partial [marine sediment metagenome]
MASNYSNKIDRHFHSVEERRWAEKLWKRERAGEISELRFQVRVKLLGIFPMKVDAGSIEDGETIYHEYKGFDTDWAGQMRKLWA